MDEKELLNRLAELPREMTPASDPWPSISARIGAAERPSSRFTRRPWWLQAVAASLLLAFAAGFLLGREWLGPDERGQRDLPLSKTDYALSASGIVGTLKATEIEYQAAFREFMAVGKTRDSLAPQTVEKLENGWAMLREAEIGLTEALQENPNDPFLNSRMLEFRSRQLGFLKQIAALDRNSRRTII